MYYLTKCNKDNLLHNFVFLLYGIPTALLIYSIAEYKKTFARKTKILMKKIYYILWLFIYACIISNINLYDISVKNSFGIPEIIWTMTVIFIILLFAAYLIDIFIFTGNGFIENTMKELLKILIKRP